MGLATSAQPMGAATHEERSAPLSFSAPAPAIATKTSPLKLGLRGPKPLKSPRYASSRDSPARSGDGT